MNSWSKCKIFISTNFLSDCLWFFCLFVYFPMGAFQRSEECTTKQVQHTQALFVWAGSTNPKLAIRDKWYHEGASRRQKRWVAFWTCCGAGWWWCRSSRWETPSRVSEITASCQRSCTLGLHSLWMVSKLEHLAFGRCCHRSFAVPVPLISRTERCITSPCGHLCWRWAISCQRLSSTRLHRWLSGSWHLLLWQVSLS